MFLQQFGSEGRDQIQSILSDCGKSDILGTMDEDDSDAEEEDEDGEEEEESDGKFSTIVLTKFCSIHILIPKQMKQTMLIVKQPKKGKLIFPNKIQLLL